MTLRSRLNALQRQLAKLPDPADDPDPASRYTEEALAGLSDEELLRLYQESIAWGWRQPRPKDAAEIRAFRAQLDNLSEAEFLELYRREIGPLASEAR
jgi:hypothetical protein